MRIAIDIDSTLHHHWDVLSEVSTRRFGIALPYDEQVSWGRTRLRSDQFELCVEESHSETRILESVPYPEAVQTICAWRGEGHEIHVVSDRDECKRQVTERWLKRIGLPFERLHCTPEKVEACVAEGVQLLIDDNPFDLQRAGELGIAVAALLHPWNEEVCEEEGLLSARDWEQLASKLELLLSTAGDSTDAPLRAEAELPAAERRDDASRSAARGLGAFTR